MAADIQIPALIITGLINFGLGLLVYIRARNDISNVLFFSITIFIALWSGAIVAWEITKLPLLENLFINVIYVSASLIASNFFLFAYSFLSFRTFAQIPKFAQYSILLSNLLIVGIVVWPGALLQGTYQAPGVDHKAITFGPAYALYAAYIVSFFTAGIIILFKKLRNEKGLRRVQLRYVLIGIILSATGATATNLFLPWVNIFQPFWLGPPLTIIMVVLFAYSIIRHHLLNVRVVTTELFTALILVVISADTILSSSPDEFITRISIFVLILIFGIFLIRGTLREIRELERLSKAKSDFVSIVSHQLRTPLTATKGFISMIKEGSGSPENRTDWLNKAYLTNESMIRLVNDILNISRIERGKLQYNFKDTNIIAIIEGIISTVRLQAEQKGIALNWEKPSEDIPPIRADAEKLEQVILNLIDNALHYTNKGHVNIRLIYLRELNRVRITILDTGIGMTREDMENLFSQFSQGAGGQRSNVEGMGLGLYVAASMIKAHNGRIWAESEGLQKGSRFYVELPVR
ncbi:MAG: ATP-binding protein [Candidatus Spechtbacterales bacterium]